MKKVINQTTWDGQQVWREETAEETLLNALKLPCEFCTHDTPCRMHYNAQLEANCGPVEVKEGDVF